MSIWTLRIVSVCNFCLSTEELYLDEDEPPYPSNTEDMEKDEFYYDLIEKADFKGWKYYTDDNGQPQFACPACIDKIPVDDIEDITD